MWLESALGGGDLLLLRQQVQLVQEGLDVAVGESLILLNAQDLAHGSIWVDGVTLLGILQLVGVDVGGEGTSDISWGHLRALSLAQEAAQLILQGDWGGEDGWALLLDNAILALLLGAATTTTSLLDLLGDALLKALQGLDGGNSLVT